MILDMINEKKLKNYTGLNSRLNTAIDSIFMNYNVSGNEERQFISLFGHLRTYRNQCAEENVEQLLHNLVEILFSLLLVNGKARFPLKPKGF